MWHNVGLCNHCCHGNTVMHFLYCWATYCQQYKNTEIWKCSDGFPLWLMSCRVLCTLCVVELILLRVILRSSWKLLDIFIRNQIHIFFTDFNKSLKYQISWESIQLGPRWYMQTGTDRMMKLTGAYRNCVNRATGLPYKYFIVSATDLIKRFVLTTF